MPLARIFLAATVAALLWAGGAAAEPRHAIAMNGEPALPADFASFPYVNPQAPKGGEITYCVVGSFDNLNPFILKSLRTSARGVIDTIFGNLVFEPLMQRSADEAFSLYPLIAQSVEMDEERSFVEFNLDPEAKWSDGVPVTPEDVLFTYDVFTEKGRPPYSDRMKRVSKLEKTGPHSVRFTFNEKADREFPLIIAMTPIIPRHAFDKETFDQTTLKPVTGSGPYIIDRVVPGERIVFRRNPDYWAKDLPSKRGADNYDRITIEYFLNLNAQFEAFKKGICAIHTDSDPVKRDRDFDFPAYQRGDVVSEEFKTGLPPVVSGFLFNTRRARFADPVVRRALGMLYDFEFANVNLFAGRYKRTVSFWQGTELSAYGRPASDAEKALLAPYPDAVRPDVMDGTYAPPPLGVDPRPTLRKAYDVLLQAGFSMRDGRLIDASGTPFGFEILVATQEQARLSAIFQRTLSKLGIDVSIRLVDDTQFQQLKQNYDFDMVIATIGFSGSLSPGIEQTTRWGSASRDVVGGFNLAGVANPAVDAMIDAMLRARTSEGYITAVRALDRVLMSGSYLVPTQHNTDQWMAYWKYLKHPAKTPVMGYQLPTWWREK